MFIEKINPSITSPQARFKEFIRIWEQHFVTSVAECEAFLNELRSNFRGHIDFEDLREWEEDTYLLMIELAQNEQETKTQDIFDEPLTGSEMGLSQQPIYDLAEILDEVNDMIEERRAIEGPVFDF